MKGMKGGLNGNEPMVEYEDSEDVDVLGIGATQHMREVLEGIGVSPVEQGVIKGMTGVILGEGRRRGLDIVSLLVDGELVSKQAQFFGSGQTKVSFDWKTPFYDGLSSYDIQGKVDLYGTSKVTDSAVLYNYPKTIAMSAYDMQTIQPIEIDGNVISQPVLIYASDTQDELKFNVIAPNGQCIIGSSDECSVQDSTKQNRGGLQSVEYDGQILRIKYSGSDSALERFSITSIDPIVGDWTVTLETEEGFIPQAQAIKDLTVKVKQKIISEMITVYSD